MIENFEGMQLNHGLMEVGYVNHEMLVSHSTSSAASLMDHSKTLSISMTATTDATGNLVLGTLLPSCILS